MFFILLAVSVVYARRLRLRNAEMAHDVRYNNADQTLQLVLPSYEESMKSKPTTPPPTFEETFSFADGNLDQIFIRETFLLGFLSMCFFSSSKYCFYFNPY